MPVKPKAFDFHGKTAPVRIFRVLSPRDGKWFYHPEQARCVTKAKLWAQDYDRPTDVRLLEVERTLNKEMLVSILMGGCNNRVLEERIHRQ